MRQFIVHANKYVEEELGYKASDFKRNRVSLGYAFVATLFDMFLIGIKFGFIFIFIVTFWTMFNSSLLQKYADSVCPLLK